jgi:hypothetical protein
VENVLGRISTVTEAVFSVAGAPFKFAQYAQFLRIRFCGVNFTHSLLSEGR